MSRHGPLTIQSLVSDPEKKLGDSENKVTELWRLLLIELDIGLIDLHRMMSRYIADPRNNIPQNASSTSSCRGNMRKEICSNSMSIGVFEKMVSTVPCDSATLTLTINRHTRKLPPVVVTVDMYVTKDQPLVLVQSTPPTLPPVDITEVCQMMDNLLNKSSVDPSITDPPVNPDLLRNLF